MFENDLDKYMNFSVKPDFKTAGPVLGKNIKEFAAKLAQLDAKELLANVANGSVKLELGGTEYDITEEFLDVRISAKEGFIVGMENNVFTILDTTLTPELVSEGYVREVISKVQQLRKQHDFKMLDHITISLEADDDVKAAVLGAIDHIKEETLAWLSVYRRREESCRKNHTGSRPRLSGFYPWRCLCHYRGPPAGYSG